MKARRYAVLHHVGIARPHFDLLFELEDNAAGLTSLRCPRWPLMLGDVLDELPEHRRAYLEYEGPISRDRGSVTRVEDGEVRVADLAIDPPTLGLTLRSTRGGEARELALVHHFDERNATTRWTVVTIA